jgi:hypothetical protein
MRAGVVVARTLFGRTWRYALWGNAYRGSCPASTTPPQFTPRLLHPRAVRTKFDNALLRTIGLTNFRTNHSLHYLDFVIAILFWPASNTGAKSSVLPELTACTYSIVGVGLRGVVNTESPLHHTINPLFQLCLERHHDGASRLKLSNNCEANYPNLSYNNR